MSRKSKAWKLLVIGLMIGFFTVAVAGCGGSDSSTSNAGNTSAQSESSKQETINLRLGHVVQVDHPMNVAAEKFAEKVKEKSNGRINITIYPARQLGDDRQLFEQVQQGSLDMAEVSVAPMGSTNEVVMALQMPFLFNDWDQYTKVITSAAADKLLAALEENNVKAFAVYNAGFRHIVTVDKPVKAPADMKGLKFRTAETPLHVDIFQALGANPTPMVYGEIYSGLQNKVIDGLEMDLSAILMEKHYEVAKNVTLSRHFTWPAILMMNLDKFNALSPEDQKILQEAAKEVIEENVKDIEEIEAQAVSELMAKGVQMTELSADELAAFVEATKGVEEKYASQNSVIAEFVKAAREAK